MKAICYYSGTGNSLWTARELSKACGDTLLRLRALAKGLEHLLGTTPGGVVSRQCAPTTEGGLSGGRGLRMCSVVQSHEMLDPSRVDVRDRFTDPMER